jgi:Acyl-CoA dehydrogenases
MSFRFSDDLEAFRTEVRSFVEAHLSPRTKRRAAEGLRLAKEDYTDWFKALHAKGWITPGWPLEHGGTDWTPLQRYIFEEECYLAGAPPVTGGMNMIGPVLIQFGSAAQKAEYLPRMRRGELWWAQGFSEPGSGSDLASLATKAWREGDEYVVNGTKIWTTQANYADMMFALVRTKPEGKPQESISMVLIPMKAPGVSIQRIMTIDGSGELYQTFLDNVRIPAANLVGEENKGWTYAKFLLGFERFGIAGIGLTKRQMDRLKRVLATEGLAEVPRWAERVARAEADLMALEFTAIRLVQESMGKAPGVESSLLKIRGTELRQRIYALTLEAAGQDAIPYLDEVLQPGLEGEAAGPEHAAALAANYLENRKISIYGGSNEIQREVLAQAALGRMR